MIRELWDDGIFGKVMLLFIAVLIIMMVSYPFAMYHDKKEMEKEHCVKTEKSRDVDYTYSILVGKIPVMQHGIRTEYLYTCDDEPRWR